MRTLLKKCGIREEKWCNLDASKKRSPLLSSTGDAEVRPDTVAVEDSLWVSPDLRTSSVAHSGLYIRTTSNTAK